MADGGEQNVPGDTVAGAPGAPGGASRALDGTNPKDQALVREAIKRWPKRWAGVDVDLKADFIEGMKEAHKKAREILKAPDPELALKAVQAIGSILKTAVAMEGQVQADDHLADKNERLDGGKSTENVAIIPAPSIRRVGDTA